MRRSPTENAVNAPELSRRREQPCDLPSQRPPGLPELQPCDTNHGSTACRGGDGGFQPPSWQWLKKIPGKPSRFAIACIAIGRSVSGHSWSVLRSITTSYGPGQQARSQRSPTANFKRPLRPPDLPPTRLAKKSTGGSASLANFAANPHFSQIG